MKFICMRKLSIGIKTKILNDLGYRTDGTYIFNSDNIKVVDPLYLTDIKFDHFCIFPDEFGRLVILDDDPISILTFMEDHDVDID